MAVAAFGLSVILIVLVKPYWGGANLRNGTRMAGAYGVWVLCLAYVLQRVREDERWPSSGMMLVGIGAAVAIIALPVQLLIWRNDVGYPLSRFRLTMWPLACGVVALLLATIGRWMARRGSAAERH